jgi:hypothetical protein
VLSWNPSREERPRTEIEVTFTEEGDKTRVDLEHRGWQNLGERGGQVRQGYDSAWSGVLAGYSETASG